ncbi:MAG: hypothetical protein R6V04_02800 [bacterium]
MAFIDYTDLKIELDKGKIDTTHEELLDILATAVLDLWDEMTNRTWASTDHTEYHSTNGVQKQFHLNNYPVNSITDIWDDPTWEYTTGDKLDTDDYTYDSNTGVVYSDAAFFEGNMNIKITYNAGYSDTIVPSWLKQVLIRQGCHWYQQAKEKRWDLASKSQAAGASTTNYNTLKGNMLPDFLLLVERHRKPAND